MPRSVLHLCLTFLFGITLVNGLSEDSDDTCRLQWQSYLDRFAQEFIRKDIENLLGAVAADYYSEINSTVLLSSPRILTRTLEERKKLPTLCDGYERVTMLDREALETENFLTTQYQTLIPSHSGSIPTTVSLPSTISIYRPRFVRDYLQELEDVRKPSCYIPNSSCHSQWSKFKIFLQSWRPYRGDMEQVFQFYQDDLNYKYAKVLGGSNMTGSDYLDYVIRMSSTAPNGIEEVFGNCGEGLDAEVVYCDRLTWDASYKGWFEDSLSTLPFNGSNLNIKDKMQLTLGCHVEMNHAVLHYFEPKEEASEDVCANDGWGEPFHWRNINLREMETALVTAITYPPFSDYRDTFDETVFRGSWTLTYPSAYLAVRAVTISNSCAYPPTETHYNVILSIAPGELKTMAVDFLSTRKPGEPQLYQTHDFDLRHLKGPVPAKDWFGAYFIYNDNPMDVALYETKDKVITEGQHRPRVLVPGLRLDKQLPHITNCVPFNTKYMRDNKLPEQPFIVWDPPRTIVGTPLVDLPTAVISVYQPTAMPGDSPIHNGPIQTTPDGSFVTPLPINIDGIDIMPNFRAPDGDSPIRPTGSGVGPGGVIDPSGENQLGAGLLVAQSGYTVTIHAGGSAVEIGGRTLRLNNNGVLLDGQRPLTTIPPSMVSQGHSPKPIPQQSKSNFPTMDQTDPSQNEPASGSASSTGTKKSGSLRCTEPRETLIILFFMTVVSYLIIAL